MCNWQFSYNFDHRPKAAVFVLFDNRLIIDMTLGSIVTDDKQGHKLNTIDFAQSTDRSKDILMIYLLVLLTIPVPAN